MIALKRPPIEGHGWFPRGIHPPDFKSLSAGESVRIPDDPATVEIPLSQHAGKPALLCVKPGTVISCGDCIAEADGFISAPVHSSLSGKTGRPVKVTLANGMRVDALTINKSGEHNHGRELWQKLLSLNWKSAEVPSFEPSALIEFIRNAGLVGQGGAAFPTAVKLSPPPGKSIRRLLINGCECEPFLTADSRLMEEAPAAIITGALLAGRACAARQVDIAVEDNKPDAIIALRKAATGSGVRVRAVPTKYPMGGEKNLIRAVYNRIVPNGGLPVDVGVAVLNVSTAASIALAVMHQVPLTHRVVTVTGAGVRKPGNFFVPVGMSFRSLLELAGGLTPDCSRLICGGPMMGAAISSPDLPVTKNSSGLVALTEEAPSGSPQTACLHCGRCVDACPLNLSPSRYAQAVRHQRWELAEREHITACMECGCCAYTCPAGLPLVQLVRTGKSEIRKRKSMEAGRG